MKTNVMGFRKTSVAYTGRVKWYAKRGRWDFLFLRLFRREG